MQEEFYQYTAARNETGIRRMLDERLLNEDDTVNLLRRLSEYNARINQKVYLLLLRYAIRQNFTLDWVRVIRQLNVCWADRLAASLFLEKGPFTEQDRDAILGQTYIVGPELAKVVIRHSVGCFGAMKCMSLVCDIIPHFYHQPTINHELFFAAVPHYRREIDLYVGESLVGGWDVWAALRNIDAPFKALFIKATEFNDVRVLETLDELYTEFKQMHRPMLLEEMQRIWPDEPVDHDLEVADRDILRHSRHIDSAIFWVNHGANDVSVLRHIGDVHQLYEIYSGARRPKTRRDLLNEFPQLNEYLKTLRTQTSVSTGIPQDMVKHIYDRYL